MTRQLHITKAFRIDYKKLAKDEVLETDTVVQELLKDKILESKF